MQTGNAPTLAEYQLVTDHKTGLATWHIALRVLREQVVQAGGELRFDERVNETPADDLGIVYDAARREMVLMVPKPSVPTFFIDPNRIGGTGPTRLEE